MATKYCRIRLYGEKNAITNINAGQNLIRNNYHRSSFIVKSTEYSNGDDIQFRFDGAQIFLEKTIQNATTGAAITLASEAAYTQGTLDEMSGRYIATAAIGTAVDLLVNVAFTVIDESTVLEADLTSS